jgi:hypothetical protein
MFKFHHLMEVHADELAKLIVLENGKNMAEALAYLAKGNETVEWACSLPQLSCGKTLEVSKGITCQESRVPLGVVAAIVPFNFPAMVPMWTIPISLTTGNCVILKPSEKVPSTMQRIAELLTEAGVPPGVFQIVHGAVDVVNAMPEQHRFLRGMFSWTGFKQVPILYDRKARAAGTPAYTWRKLFALAADGILSFSVRPLRLATALAGLLAASGLLVTVWLVLGYTYFDHPPQGWTSLMVVFLFVSALQLLVLGVIGEYIGRIFVEQKARPVFIVSERTGEES